MGTYAHVWLDGIHLGRTKDNVDHNLLSVFRTTDKNIATSLPAEIPEFMRYIANELGQGDDLTFVWYRIPVAVLRQRLNVLGYTFKTSCEAFDASVEEEKKSNAAYEIQRRERLGNYPKEMAEHHAREAAILDRLSAEVWLRELCAAFPDLAAKELVQPTHTTDLEIAEHIQSRGWFGYPGPDLLVPVRLALEAFPDSAELIYDLTDFVVTDGFDPGEAYMGPVGDQSAAEYDPTAKIVVLTEGKTDAWILQQSLEVLHPALMQYYSFLQFEDMRVSGGAGNLANLVKAFAGARIANRVIGLFDNDTAGHTALRSLDKLTLPSHIKVMTLPNLPILNAYPTLGPTGMAQLDVNGVAAGIELYLGEDVLRGADGELMPVQWTGYDWGLGRYQGEVMEKSLLHERFREKLAFAKSRSTLELDGRWSGLEAVLEAIFGVFHDLSAREILAFLHDYYETMR
jgi:HEPN/Toprim N-terminal domain 1